MTTSSTSARQWRLRGGIVGTRGPSLILRRGDLVFPFEHRAISAPALRLALLRLSMRFDYNELLRVLSVEVAEDVARELLVALREGGVVDAPFPDRPDDDWLLFDGWSSFASVAELGLRRFAVVGEDLAARELQFHFSELLRCAVPLLPYDALEGDALENAHAIVLSTTGLDDAHSTHAASRLRALGRVWMPIGDDGELARAGPIFAAEHKSSVCPRCVDRRWAAAHAPSQTGGGPGPRLAMAALSGLHQLLRVVCLPPQRAVLADRVFVVADDLDPKAWIVAPNPACPLCKTQGPGGRDARRYRVRREANEYADGELRDESAAAALARLGTLDGPLNALQARAPTALARSAALWRARTTVVLAGDGDAQRQVQVDAVGTTPDHARLWSLARALERSCLATDGTEQRTFARAAELTPDVVSPRRFDPAEDDEVPRAWVWADDLLARRKVAVPAARVLTPYAAMPGEAALDRHTSTVGVGVGLSRASALWWAILELLEADALARIDALDAQRLPLADDAALGDGLRVVAHQIWLDAGVPLVVVHLVSPDTDALLARGSCAHPSAAYAERHARMEALRRLELPPPPRPRWLDAATRTATPLDVTTGNVHDDLTALLARLRGGPHNFYAVDLTRAPLRSEHRFRQWAWDVSCVRVLSPELRSDRIELDDVVDVPRPTAIARAPISTSALRGQRVRIVGEGPLADLVARRLDALGVPHSPGDPEANVHIVTSGERAARALRDLPPAGAAGVWAFVAQRGDVYDAGPVVDPRARTGCPRCIRRHSYDLAGVPAGWIDAVEALPDGVGGIAHAGARLALELLLTQLARFLGGVREGLRVDRVGPSEEIQTLRFEPHSECGCR